MISKFVVPVFVVAAALSLSACATTGAGSGAMLSTPMPVSAVATIAPAGFGDFCRRLPSQCAINAAEAAAASEEAETVDMAEADEGVQIARVEPLPELALAKSGAFDWSSAFGEDRADDSISTERVQAAMTPTLWARLDEVNRRINQVIQPMEDVDAFGKRDVWALPLTEGIGAKGNCKHYALEKREALIRAGVPMGALSVAIARTRSGDTHAVLVVATDRGDFVLDNLSTWITPWRETGYHWLERQAPNDPRRWVRLSGL